MSSTKWKASNQVFVVSDTLDTSILEADDFHEAVPVLLDDMQHFVTYRNWKLVARGAVKRNLLL